MLGPGIFTFLWAIIRSYFRTKISRCFSGTPSFGVRASEEPHRAGVVPWDAVLECLRPDRTAKGFGFYSLNVETDHVLFALDALRFFAELAQKDNFALEATTNWEDLNDANLKPYQLVIWLDDSPQTRAEREAFEKYMT